MLVSCSQLTEPTLDTETVTVGILPTLWPLSMHFYGTIGEIHKTFHLPIITVSYFLMTKFQVLNLKAFSNLSTFLLFLVSTILQGTVANLS